MNLKARLGKLEETIRDNEPPPPIGIVTLRNGESQEDGRKRHEAENGLLPEEVIFILVRGS